MLFEKLIFKSPFVVSLSNQERPFDRLRVSGKDLVFVTMIVGMVGLQG